MTPRFHIDAAAFASLLAELHEQTVQEQKGDVTDFQVYTDASWLVDSVVIENIQERRGVWVVNLLFAYNGNPLKFILRRITSETSLRRATQKAVFMRRIAAKHPRGTQTISTDLLLICGN